MQELCGQYHILSHVYHPNMCRVGYTCRVGTYGTREQKLHFNGSDSRHLDMKADEIHY